MHVLAIATVASVMLTPVDLLPDELGGAIIGAHWRSTATVERDTRYNMDGSDKKDRTTRRRRAAAAADAAPKPAGVHDREI